jgi:hypothetical protein
MWSLISGCSASFFKRKEFGVLLIGLGNAYFF